MVRAGIKKGARLSSLMGTVIGDLGTPSVWNAAVAEKYKLYLDEIAAKLIEPRRSYGERFELPERVYDVYREPSLFERCAVLLNTYVYVLDETKRVPITRQTYIPQTGSVAMRGGKTERMETYSPDYFLNRIATPTYKITTFLVPEIKAFRKPKVKLEKPFKWDLVENPEEDWF